MNKQLLRLMAFPLICLMGGCGEADPDAPPQVLLGQSTCLECGMIVSDERFGTATILEGNRGSEVMIFDDFNCQKNFELKHPELKLITRWSRDYESLEWFHTGDGWLVRSDLIRSPMASGVAGFKTHHDAVTFAESVTGVVITYKDYAVETTP